MIPREILKKIRQIELRTNRSTPAIFNAPTNHHALRLGLRPQPRSVSVSRHFNSIEFDGIRNRADESALVLIPSNSTGLNTRRATNFTH